jgi:hypothetical protein
VGYHNNNPEPFATEVNMDGEIVWEWTFNITENDEGFAAIANGHERLFVEPLIEVNANNATGVYLSVWDTFKRRLTTDGTIRVTDTEMNVLVEEDFEFLPYWQETQLEIQVTGLPAGENNLQVEIENSDGVKAETVITITVQADLIPYVVVGAGAIVVVVIVLIIYKKRT